MAGQRARGVASALGHRCFSAGAALRALRYARVVASGHCASAAPSRGRPEGALVSRRCGVVSLYVGPNLAGAGLACSVRFGRRVGGTGGQALADGSARARGRGGGGAV